jgi:hypothetical protein
VTDRETLARHGHSIGGLKSQQAFLREEVARCRSGLEGLRGEVERRERASFRALLAAVALGCFLATLLLGRAFG